MKRGQFTIFTILGILLVISIGIIFYAINTNENIGTSQTISTLPQIQELDRYIDECLEDKIDDSLLDLGQDGFVVNAEYVYEIENITEDIDLLRVNYVYYNSQVVLSDLKELKEKLVQPIQGFACFSDIEADSSYSIAEVTLNENIEISLTNEAVVTYENDTYDLTTERTFKKELDLEDIYTLVETISTQDDPSIIEYDTLLESNFEASVIQADEETIIYIIEYKELEINDTPFKVIFAIDLS
jgi:hypothetical protein